MYRIRDWLYIGNYREAGDEALLRSRGINAVLHLIFGITLPPDIERLCTPVADGTPLPIEQLERGVAFVRAQKAEGRSILIACAAGISRSVSFTMAVLHEEEGLSIVDAYRDIHQFHPDATPHPELLNSLRAYYNDPMPLIDLLRAIRQISRGI
jgi:protein-tyrosine phosphatase